MTTKEEALKFLQSIDYRFNKYGEVVASSENEVECWLQYQDSKYIDSLIDASSGQFTGGYSEEIYYSTLDNYYRIFELDAVGNVIKYEVRRKD